MIVRHQATFSVATHRTEQTVDGLSGDRLVPSHL